MRSQLDTVEVDAVLSRLFAAGVSSPYRAALALTQLPGQGREMTRSDLGRRVDAYIDGVPLDYLLGTTSFLGLDFACLPGTFLPRVTSEPLIDRAAKLLGHSAANHSVVDLFCGIGAIAIALAVLFERATYLGIDMNGSAIELARINAERLAPGATIDFVTMAIRADSQVSAAGSVNLMLANPPYLPSRVEVPAEMRFHPREALFAGRSGTECIDVCLRVASNALVPGGVLLVEHDPAQAGIAKWMGEQHRELSWVSTASASFSEFRKMDRK